MRTSTTKPSDAQFYACADYLNTLTTDEYGFSNQSKIKLFDDIIAYFDLHGLTKTSCDFTIPPFMTDCIYDFKEYKRELFEFIGAL